jgi:uncharacterized surface protein with fasciclin (FAS1) repeats
MTSSAAPSTSAMADPAADLVGSGCAGYAQKVPSGPGSVAGMAQDPVAVAASNNPELTTLTSALSGKLNPNVNLVETLNSNPGLTVFAPTNEAFAKIDAATLEKLKTDSDLLTKILTYHVVAGNYDSNKLRSLILEGNGTATLNTVSGGKLWLMMNGSTNITVKDEKGDIADITISDVRQSNGVIQVVDHVLHPRA